MVSDSIATVYIDGFNLYYGMMEKGWGCYRWLDLYGFSQAIIPIGYRLGSVKYFTSRIKGDVQRHNRQALYLKALETHCRDKIAIQYGKYQLFPSHCKHCNSSPVYCQNCGSEYSKPNEKKTDVNIAASILVDCFERITNCIVLVSGDSDYEAVLLEMKRLFPDVHRVIAFPPARKNPALFRQCDEHYGIKEDCFSTHQLPNPVISPVNGKRYSKPLLWP